MNKEFKKLQKENSDIRDSLDGYLPIENSENERCWKLINELIENEIEQESYCNQ